jgi:hypothetical protein
VLGEVGAEIVDSLKKRLGFQSIPFELEKTFLEKPLIDVKGFVLNSKPVIGKNKNGCLVIRCLQDVSHRFVEMFPEVMDQLSILRVMDVVSMFFRIHVSPQSMLDAIRAREGENEQFGGVFFFQKVISFHPLIK